MQDYYNKKAKECESLVNKLQEQISVMKAEDARSLQFSQRSGMHQS